LHQLSFNLLGDARRAQVCPENIDPVCIFSNSDVCLGERGRGRGLRGFT
jgi:hypothetical protein